MANSSSQPLTITERLPPEIMSDIFVLCTPSTIMRHYWDDINFQLGISIPLTLSSVCGLRRSAAHSTPALWMSFRIYLPFKSPQRTQQAQRWLSRSGQLPLSIKIRPHPSRFRDRSYPLVDEMINLINSYSHRWESLEIASSPEVFRRFSDNSTSVLKTLVFFPDHGSHLSYDYLLKVCWNNVVHFTVRYIGIGQAVEIFRLAPQLREFFFSNITILNSDNPPLPSPPLLHMGLETLHVNDYPVPRLFDSITLPSLKTLHYTGYGPLPFSSIFLNRSGCSLKTFTLVKSYTTDAVILPVLFAMPHLETLTLRPPKLRFPYITNRMLHMLADTATISPCLHDQPDGPFLPKLRSLTYIGFPTFSWNCIPIVFGHGTKEPGASPKSDQRPLQSFSIKLYYLKEEPESNVISELNHLMDEEGYEIQIFKVSRCYSREVERDLLDGT